MSLPKLAINRPVMAWMMMLALIVFGLLSYQGMGVSQLPDVDFPVVSVSLSLNGAAPEVMESQVVDPLEDAIMQIEGIRSVTSNAQQSSASISIEFELNRSIDKAEQEVESRINQVRNVLPVDLNPPVVRKTNPEDQPIIWVALTSSGKASKNEMMRFAHDTLMPQFTTIPGVGDIALGGYVDPALRVWLDQNKLTPRELTAGDVINSIQTEHVEVPLGQVSDDKKEFNVRLLGEAKTPQEFSRIRINSRVGAGPNYKDTTLGDVAKIEEGTVDVRKMARFNGQDAIGLGILKQHGANAVEVANLVREKLKDVAANLPEGYQVSLRSDSTRFIKDSVKELVFTLCLSALLTSLVCFLFLGSWTATFNVLLAIPTSIIGAFIVMRFFGFTINTFTLLGLSLAIGIVVDDAIMMLENMTRHFEEGAPQAQAGLKGAEEITFAALAATVAVVAIFLPVIFIKGVIGKYFFQYGIVVSSAVLLSLFEALTLTPMRFARYFK
ncbi:MAG: efflux RND transporter permease subunit, partial [Pseudobdellovibrio sp.]